MQFNRGALLIFLRPLTNPFRLDTGNTVSTLVVVFVFGIITQSIKRGGKTNRTD